MPIFLARPPHFPKPPSAIPFSRVRGSASLKIISSWPGENTLRFTPSSLECLGQFNESPIAFSAKGILHYLFTDPSSAREILVSKSTAFQKGEQETVFSAAIGWGLLVDEGESHRKSQLAISPALRGEVLNQYVASIVSSARKSLASLRESEPLVLTDFIRCFTQASAESALFKPGAEETDFSYQRAVLSMTESIGAFSSDSLSDERFKNELASFKSNQDTVQKHVRGIVERWKGSTERPSTLMDVMLEPTTEDGGEFGPLLSQVSMFLQAAMETTASLLSWTIVLLSNNPEFWDELRLEARANPNPPSFRDWSSLKWHRAVLNESLRLRPPAWMLPRIANENVLIGDVMLERGARVIVSPWLTHRVERIHRNPLAFEPQRWLEEGATKIPRGGFFPFGLGQRVCIGERYGLLTASIFLHELALLDVLPSLTSSSLEVGSSSLIANPSSDIQVSLKPS